jgi:hypothetical protein
LLRELVQTRGAELRRRFGAHSIGIGRKRAGGKVTDQLALIVYVERKGSAKEPVPATIEFTPAGHDRPVELATDVVEAPPVEPQ